MADNELKISIRTTADTAGAESAKASLAGVKGAAQEASTAGAGMARDLGQAGQAAQQGAAQAGSGLKDVMGGLKSAKLLTSAFSLAMAGEFSMAVKLATVAVKGLSTALKQNPLGLVIAALGIAVSLYAKFSASVKKAADEADNLDNSATGAAQSMRGLGAAGAQAGDGTANALQHAVDAGTLLVEKFDEATKAAARLRKQQDELGDAALAESLAKVDLQEEKGSLSPEEASRQRTKLRADAERTKLAGEKEEAASESTRANDALAQFRIQRSGDIRSYEAAKQRMVDARNAEINFTGSNPKYNARLAEKRKAAEEEFAKYQNPADTAEEAAKTEAELAQRIEDANHRVRVAEIRERALAVKSEAEITKADNAEQQKAREAAAKAQHEANLEAERALENQVTLAEQQLAATQKDSDDYRAAVEKVAIAKKQLAARKASDEDTEGNATPATREAAQLQQKGLGEAAAREEQASRVREAQRQEALRKQREKEEAQAEKDWQEFEDGVDEMSRKPKRRRGDPIDARAPQANPPRGLRSGGLQGGTPMEDEETFRGRFQPHLDFSATPKTSAAEGGAGGMEEASGELKNAAQSAQKVASNLQSSAVDFQGLQNAITANHNATMAQIAQLKALYYSNASAMRQA